MQPMIVLGYLALGLFLLGLLLAVTMSIFDSRKRYNATAQQTEKTGYYADNIGYVPTEFLRYLR